MPEAVVGNAPTPADPSQNGGALPMLTNSGDQTKNHVVLHVEHPTKPYRILCSRCETHWCIWLGAGVPYQCLPMHRSGCASILSTYYQSLPAAELNTHTMISSILFYILIVGLWPMPHTSRHDIERMASSTTTPTR